MSVKHTPGPWMVDARLTITDSNGEFVADAAQIQFGESGEYSLDTAEPNFRLIAAAPDLCEAASNLAALRPSNWRDDDELVAAYAAVDAAPAKALGQ